MSCNQIKLGSATVEQFIDWMIERHSIWRRRQAGEPKPWTTDAVLRQYKFTNVYRELDKGTIALRQMCPVDADPSLIVMNTWWYRLYNWHEHASRCGFCHTYGQLEHYLMRCHREGRRIFTGAYMSKGVLDEPKVITYLKLLKEQWASKDEWTRRISKTKTMQGAFNEFMTVRYMGDFSSYELVCDLRWSVLRDATDTLTWANVGIGARRGLLRLGLAPITSNIRYLWERVVPLAAVALAAPVPFEMREIEHSLCEFDKYRRVIEGQGRPRSKYHGQ